MSEQAVGSRTFSAWMHMDDRIFIDIDELDECPGCARDQLRVVLYPVLREELRKAMEQAWEEGRLVGAVEGRFDEPYEEENPYAEEGDDE